MAKKKKKKMSKTIRKGPIKVRSQAALDAILHNGAGPHKDKRDKRDKRKKQWKNEDWG